MAEDEIIKKHTKAAYKSWRDPEKDWKHKFKEIVGEIAIIVFAVTISIWFHNWSESMHDKNDEKEFLKGLKIDLLADLKEMKGDRAALQKELIGAQYFQKVGSGETLAKDSLNKYVWIFFADAQINPRISRFEALKGSGKIDIIENKKLQYNIIDLYQKNFPQIFRMNQAVNSLVADKIDDYIGDNVQFDAKGSITNAQEMLRKSKMRLFLARMDGLGNSIKAYSDGIDKGNEIVKQIDEELN